MSNTVKCKRPAITAATWVNGQRIVLCEPCMQKALQVAQALGAPLFMSPLQTGETECTQNVRRESTPSIATT